MGQVLKIAKTPERRGGDPLGFHRVLMPKGVLPQAAERLDAGLPIFSNEMLLEVERLNLDSASFRQIWEEQEGVEEQVINKILQIVRARNKMHNPETGSGGMLLGRVTQVGKEFPHKFSVGDLVATLVSLTLTPLHIENISGVDPGNGQINCRGYAVLFASGIAVRLPEDIPEASALSALDVCGAPAWVKRLLEPKDRVLIIGMGKAGKLCSLAARDVVPGRQITLVDRKINPKNFGDLLGDEIEVRQANAAEPREFQKILGPEDSYDLVINTCNTPNTEAATLLAAKKGGKVLFFNMATDFSRAVLTAEGMGKDVKLIMGNGYAEGHAHYALNLLRRYPGVIL